MGVPKNNVVGSEKLIQWSRNQIRMKGGGGGGGGGGLYLMVLVSSQSPKFIDAKIRLNIVWQL